MSSISEQGFLELATGGPLPQLRYVAMPLGREEVLTAELIPSGSLAMARYVLRHDGPIPGQYKIESRRLLFTGGFLISIVYKEYVIATAGCALSPHAASVLRETLTSIYQQQRDRMQAAEPGILKLAADWKETVLIPHQLPWLVASLSPYVLQALGATSWLPDLLQALAWEYLLDSPHTFI